MMLEGSSSTKKRIRIFFLTNSKCNEIFSDFNQEYFVNNLCF